MEAGNENEIHSPDSSGNGARSGSRVPDGLRPKIHHANKLRGCATHFNHAGGLAGSDLRSIHLTLPATALVLAAVFLTGCGLKSTTRTNSADARPISTTPAAWPDQI